MLSKLIAEVANVHEGDYNYLYELCNQIGKTNLNKIKFQYIIPEEFCEIGSEQFIEFKRLQISFEQYNALLKELVNYKIYFDVLGNQSLSEVKNLKRLYPNICGIKFHSTDALNTSMIIDALDSFDQVIISIGGLTIIEINSLIKYLNNRNVLNRIIFSYGVQSYPSLPEQSRINKLIELKKIYNITICLSDHIDGENQLSKDIVKYAFLLGYDYVEKHITQNRSRRLDDDHSALEIDEFIQLENDLLDIENLFSSNILKLNKDELIYRKNVKKSIFAKLDIPSGIKVTEKNIFSRRLNKNEFIDHVNLNNVLDKTAILDISKGTKINTSKIKNNIFGLILVRSESSRLPNKCFKKIANTQAINLIIRRIKHATQLTKIIVCTTTSKKDDKIEKISIEEGVEFFRGSENVALRIDGAFQKYGFPDIFVRLTGDNIMVDPEHIDNCIAKFLEHNFDYYKHDKVIEGFDFELIKFEAYETLDIFFSNYRDNSEYMTLFLNNNYFEIMEPVQYKYNLNIKDYRFTLDYDEDLKNIKNIVEYVNDIFFSYDTICNYLLKESTIYKPFNPYVKGKKIHTEKRTLF